MKLLKRGNLIAGGVALLLGLALLITAALLPRKLQNQYQAERWAGESGERFLQFSCILAPGKLLETSAVYSFRETALKKFAESDHELPSDGSAICDAWSTGGTLKVSGDRGSFDAAALAVGGRFFDFHPQTLLSGVYLAETDLLRDRVVLDEQLAWMLFGASDVAGMTVTIGEREFRVAGVVTQPDDRYTRAAGGITPTIYLPDECRELLTGEGVACYEVVLPEPVKGFGKSIAEGTFAGRGSVVQCTDRFTFASSLRRLLTLTKQGVRDSAVVFPSWENAAVIAENACAIVRALALLCFVLPAVLLAAAAVHYARRGLRLLRRGGGAVKEALLSARDRRRAGRHS
jgi:hypothetical protein